VARSISSHRNNALLADLPVIQQAYVLSHVESIDFLRQLSKAVPLDELKRDKDDAAFQHDLEEFRKVNSLSLAERREWVDSLSADEKATLAEQSRTFENRRPSQTDKNRLHELVETTSQDPHLEETLIAYGQWLKRQTAAQLE